MSLAELLNELSSHVTHERGEGQRSMMFIAEAGAANAHLPWLSPSFSVNDRSTCVHFATIAFSALVIFAPRDSSVLASFSTCDLTLEATYNSSMKRTDMLTV